MRCSYLISRSWVTLTGHGVSSDCAAAAAKIRMPQAAETKACRNCKRLWTNCDAFVILTWTVVLKSLSTVYRASFLGTFANLRKGTVTFVRYLSFLSHGTRLPLDGFLWNLVLEYFSENLSRKCKFHWNMTGIRVLYMATNIHFWSYLTQFFLEWKMFQTEVVEKIETHVFMFNNLFFENHVVYKIMLKIIVKLGRPQTTIWRMHIACWIPEATNTLRTCNTYRFSTATVVARTRMNVTL
jgi:hypothetical protein